MSLAFIIASGFLALLAFSLIMFGLEEIDLTGVFGGAGLALGLLAGAGLGYYAIAGAENYSLMFEIVKVL